MKPAARSLIHMRDALEDPRIFGQILSGESWAAWRAGLIASRGEKISRAERLLLEPLTERSIFPTKPVRRFTACVGRRGGKTRALAVMAAYLAALVDWREVIVKGETGTLLIVANTTQQAKVCFSHVLSIFEESPALRGMITRQTNDTIELGRLRTAIRVLPASSITSRGHSYIGVILEEFSFFDCREDMQLTDTELLRAITPALVSTRGPLIMISSAFLAEGEFWKSCTTNWAEAGGDRALVIRAQSHEMNPTLLNDEEIAQAYLDDPISARSEYGSQWRDAKSNFIARTQIMEIVEQQFTRREPELNSEYVAGVDMSSGLGKNSAACAVSHYDPVRDQTLLDAVLEIRPPFKAIEAVEQFARFLMPYQIQKVYGDRIGNYYIGDFRKNGLEYCSEIDAEHNVPRKADNYLALLPLISSHSISLINNERLIDQLCALSRRPMAGGYERIEASTGYNDDISDCVAISLTICHQRKACNSFLAPVMRADGRIMSRQDAFAEGCQEMLLEMGIGLPDIPPGPWSQR